jgi:methyl-accepting chemotaxis protein
MEEIMDFAAKLMNNLSYTKKLSLIAFIFLLPIIATTWIVITDESAGIYTTETEIDGLNYINTLRKLYQHIPEHRGMTNAFRNGNSSFE